MGAVRTIRMTYGLHTDQLGILITPGIRKPFTENSSSLIFPWRPHGHFTSVADATMILRTVRTCSQVKYIICKQLTIFHIWYPSAIWWYIRPCVTGVLHVFTLPLWYMSRNEANFIFHFLEPYIKANKIMPHTKEIPPFTSDIQHRWQYYHYQNLIVLLPTPGVRRLCSWVHLFVCLYMFVIT